MWICTTFLTSVVGGMVNIETSVMKKKLKRRNSRAKFSRLAHANFDNTCNVVHPTFANGMQPENDDQARAEERNFIRRLARVYKKYGVPFRYLATGHRGEKSGRYNYHILVPGGVPVADIIAAWGLGRCNVDPLQFVESGINDLIKYIGRDADELDDDDGDDGADLSIWKKRYICSQGLRDTEPEYNNRVARKDMEYIASQVYEAGMISTDGKKFIAKRYPGYDVAEAFVTRSEVIGGTYVRLRLYKPDSPLLKWRKKINSRTLAKMLAGDGVGL